MAQSLYSRAIQNVMASLKAIDDTISFTEFSPYSPYNLSESLPKVRSGDFESKVLKDLYFSTLTQSPKSRDTREILGVIGKAAEDAYLSGDLEGARIEIENLAQKVEKTSRALLNDEFWGGEDPLELMDDDSEGVMTRAIDIGFKPEHSITPTSEQLIVAAILQRYLGVDAFTHTQLVEGLNRAAQAIREYSQVFIPKEGALQDVLDELQAEAVRNRERVAT